MSSRPGAAGLLLTTALSAFVLVLGLGWMVASQADRGEQPPPPASTAAVRLVVGAGQLGVDKQPIEPFRGVLVVVRDKARAEEGSSGPADPSAPAGTGTGPAGSSVPADPSAPAGTGTGPAGSSASADPSGTATGPAGAELCLTTPGGGWRPAGDSWRATPQGGATRYCRDIGSDELTAPVEIELTR